jgi:hypothetical protein
MIRHKQYSKSRTQDYTDDQQSALLDHYYRDHPRPAPWPIIIKAMGISDVSGAPKGVVDLLWRLKTGHNGDDPDGPRLVHRRHGINRFHRSGQKWWPREDEALSFAKGPEGQRRHPPCDPKYMSVILARTVEEVEERWEKVAAAKKDSLGRDGFFDR